MKSFAYLLGHILSCKKASRYASRLQDGTLTGWERWRYDLHLRVCDKCTRFAQQLDFMREALRRYRS